MPSVTQDGFRTVGDMGWLDEDGYLHIADRRTDMIISGGANVFPAEVEAALCRHPGVAEAGVVGIPDDEMGAAHTCGDCSDSGNQSQLTSRRVGCIHGE